MNQSLKIDPYGFREYDARWLYEKDINTKGIINLGKGLGLYILESYIVIFGSKGNFYWRY